MPFHPLNRFQPALTKALMVLTLITFSAGCNSEKAVQPVSNEETPQMKDPASGDSSESLEKIVKTEAEWKELLTAEQFKVTRQQGTERPRSGKYWDAKTEGTYTCICCDLPLFSSGTKYKSGTGWPSFWDPIKSENVTRKEDNTLFSKRTEVVCTRCDAHLGHVFNDGPQPTGLRYCMNSAALNMVEKGAETKSETEETTEP